MKSKIKLLLCVLLCAFSLTACATQTPIDYVETENTTYTKVENDVTAVYEKVSKGCVGIYASNQTSAGSGSGVVYKKVENTYYVVTNAHVVEDMTSYKISLGGVKYYNANLIGYDSTNDIAVLTFNLDLLSSDIEIYVNNIEETVDVITPGQTVIAVGCPLSINNYNSVTTGVVSLVTTEQVQHDAAINPGNSGGGLFNLSGRLIGINNEKEVFTTSSLNGVTTQIPVEGVGFAISMPVVRHCIATIESKGTVTRPLLGITVTSVNTYINTTSPYLEYLPSGVEFGVVITDITHNGNGENGGLKINDCLLSIDDNLIKNSNVISDILHQKTNGESVSVKIYRKTSNEYLTLNIKLIC